MALASAAGALLKPQTPLQQLLEDINFQRTKEMRQLLKDGKYNNLLIISYYEEDKTRDFRKICLHLHIIDLSNAHPATPSNLAQNTHIHLHKYTAVRMSA